jgi:hypothetical protein
MAHIFLEDVSINEFILLCIFKLVVVFLHEPRLYFKEVVIYPA